MRQLRHVGIVMMAIWIVGISRLDGVEGDQLDSLQQVDNVAEAITRATKYVDLQGLDKVIPGDSTANNIRLARISDSTTPFLAVEINGRSVWRIELKDVILDLERTSSEREAESPKDFEIYIDSATGLPLKIISRSRTPIEREPTFEEATDMLLKAGEKYTGLPKVIPKLSFAEALDKCKFYPVLAKEIIANYVIYTGQPSIEERPAWTIHLRGLPPLSDKQNVFIHCRTTLRFVVDAMSGRVLCINNAPYPIILEN